MSAAGAEWEGGDSPLRGVRVLTLAVNLPAPVAASRLCAMGASVIKVEPPGGDPLALMCPGSEAARSFAEPLRQGLTAPGGILGGGFPGYGLYRAREGHVALGALEPHFWDRLSQELGVKRNDCQNLGRILETKTAEQWEAWAADRDLPLAVVRDVEQNEVDETASASQRRRTSTRGEDE